MPLGKGRRRSTGSSTPVVTTIAFVALCVLGVWLLASTPVGPPKSTTKTATAVTTTSSSLASSVLNFRNTISNGAAKTTPNFEDLPGDLPEDSGNGGSSSEVVSNDSQSAGSGTNESGEKEMVDQESGSVKNQESSEELHGKETEKQKELETQVSEESIITQQKEIETIKQNAEAVKKEESIENPKAGNEETKVQESQTSSQESSVENKNLISDEDQRKRLEQHQQQEDDQIQQRQSQPEVREEGKDPKKAWLTTQADQSVNQKERKEGAKDQESIVKGENWQLCNVTAGADFIPCLDNEEALAKIRGRQHYEHRERHCPTDPPVCLVPLPVAYKKSLQWPQSRDKARRNIFCQL